MAEYGVIGTIVMGAGGTIAAISYRLGLFQQATISALESLTEQVKETNGSVKEHEKRIHDIEIHGCPLRQSHIRLEEAQAAAEAARKGGAGC